MRNAQSVAHSALDKSTDEGYHFYAYHGTDNEGRNGIIGWGIY